MQYKNITVFGLTLVFSLSSISTPLADLFKGIEDGDNAKVATALQAKADPNGKNSDGYTVLTWAVRWHREAMLPTLIQHGAKVDDQDDNGQAPIHVAVSYGFKEETRTLIQQKALTDRPNRYGQTLPTLAVESGNFDMLDVISEEGAGMDMLRMPAVGPDKVPVAVLKPAPKPKKPRAKVQGGAPRAPKPVRLPPSGDSQSSGMAPLLVGAGVVLLAGSIMGVFAVRGKAR